MPCPHPQHPNAIFFDSVTQMGQRWLSEVCLVRSTTGSCPPTKVEGALGWKLLLDAEGFDLAKEAVP
ncbi:hypothetical protein ACJIZ3_010003 [Penstemon smallii]|uniref:Uncharacterized protein n=1 Tax=Penstemon smallii TaxID=265156 RepID=A0ABD3TG14_9LAMI